MKHRSLWIILLCQNYRFEACNAISNLCKNFLPCWVHRAFVLALGKPPFRKLSQYTKQASYEQGQKFSLNCATAYALPITNMQTEICASEGLTKTCLYLCDTFRSCDELRGILNEYIVLTAIAPWHKRCRFYFKIGIFLQQSSLII